MFPVLDKDLDIKAMEARVSALWEKEKVYDYAPQAGKPVFSVDTPPPYVSAAHLHVGHAMSYTQAEIVVRYKRMQGHTVFYPMGFDDNGLPTERFVEQTYKINKSKISRADFRALCIEETAKGAKEYEKLWRGLGLSVDWGLRYSTIDERSRHTSQKSFLDLYKKGLVYRANEPVLWDTHFETSLAQADLETIARKGKMFDVRFSAADNGADLVISTTRPELIPACVGLFVHPEDERYKNLHGRKANVPLFSYQVPILTSEDVDPEFGTGLMMVCTFGDGEDVKKWKLNKLETRLILDAKGKMNALAGAYEGLSVAEARKRIVADLSEQGLLLGEKTVDQNVSVGERSEVPVEFMMTPQWFINVLDHKDRLLARAKALNWFPAHMSLRLDQWIEGLKYDWNISRQRFYGVPFPVWYVQETGDVIVADEKDLPVDPTEDAPPAWALEKYKGMTIVPETDVMDTWMTSSLTPMINANWAGRSDVKGGTEIYPMSLRVQAFEIIRTWLFYTLVKGDYHTESLPWKDVMISGWGLNEQGKKVSKRDLERFTDPETGFNRYNPYSLIERYGADAVRSWASSSSLGHDLRFHEKDVKDGRKVVVKLWNVARMGFLYMEGFDPKTHHVPVAERPVEDQWILFELNKVTARMTEALDRYDYATAKEALNKFFWTAYCDDYLEIIKGRFWEAAGWSERDRHAAQCTLHETMRVLIGLFAPYLPFITEEIYQKAGRFNEESASLHTSPWPAFDPSLTFGRQQEMDVLRAILYGVRKIRSDRKIGGGTVVEKTVLSLSDAGEGTQKIVEGIIPSIQGATRSMQIIFGGDATEAISISGVKVDIVAYPEGEAPKMTTTLKSQI